MSVPEPENRLEQYLSGISNNDVSVIPEYPILRIEQYLDYIAKNGIGQDSLRYLGVTTTELSDGSSTNPITIDGESVTAEKTDWVIYQSKDFIFNGTVWQEVGDFENYYTKTEADNTFVAKTDIDIKTAPTTAEINAAITDIWGA